MTSAAEANVGIPRSSPVWKPRSRRLLVFKSSTRKFANTAIKTRKSIARTCAPLPRSSTERLDKTTKNDSTGAAAKVTEHHVGRNTRIRRTDRGNVERSQMGLRVASLKPATVNAMTTKSPTAIHHPTVGCLD